MSSLRPIITGGTTCERHQYGAPLRLWRYERSARQRGAWFEALYQRQNELTKQHTKQSAADNLQVAEKPQSTHRAATRSATVAGHSTDDTHTCNGMRLAIRDIGLRDRWRGGVGRLGPTSMQPTPMEHGQRFQPPDVA
eukprot:4730147-Pleurochrysis_carterae.AAC.2